MSTTSKRLTNILGGLVVIAIPFVVWAQRWNIYDYWRLRGYKAPAIIEQLATDTSMNGKMRHLFYVYRPELEDRDTFSSSCSATEKTIVLGCYVSGSGIYLFNVTDQRLDGVIQVTAAHEALHAVYDRLSPGDKAHVNELVETAFAKVNDARIKETIDEYRTNGADVDNELHSILGTEVRELPTELEQYYKRYFSDRLKIVSFSEKYEQAFTERKQKIADYDKQLESLKQQIDGLTSDLKSREHELVSERARLDALLEAKKVQEYNSGVAGFNAKVNDYNALVAKVRGLIDQYNQVVAARNVIAAEEGELIKAIDSRPDTIPTQ